MRRGLVLAALLLPLGGCYVPPQPVPYGYGGYPVQPGADVGYPGYAYNDGSPTYVEGGVTWPLIFYGGGWGYWDGYHHWHGAPDRVRRDLDMRHPGGVGYRPFGGGQFGRPVGGGFPGGRPGVAPGGFRPGGAPGGFRPGGAPGAFRPGPANVQRAAPSREAPARHRQDEHH